MVKTLTGVTNQSIANTLKVNKVSANNSLGNAGQVLTSNGTVTYWATPTAEAVVNTSAQYIWTNTNIFNANVTVNAALIANGSPGTAGHVLHSNGTAVYWAVDDTNLNTTYDLLAVANTETNKGIIRLKDVNNSNDDVYVTGAGGVVVSSNASHILITGQSGDITGVSAGDGLTGTTTSGEALISVLANTGIFANATGTYVNAAYIATIASNTANYANASYTNTFTVGTATYFVANGNVGIGTNSPTKKLHVVGATSGSFLGDIARFENSPVSGGYVTISLRQNVAGGNDLTSYWGNDATKAWIGTSEAFPFAVFTNGTEKFRVTAAGNVGIGNTAPTDKLSVNGTSYFQANVTLTSALIANSSAGSAGEVLHSNGTATYWAADDNTNTTYDLLTVANTVANKAIIRLTDSSSANDDAYIIGANGITSFSNSTAAYAYAVGSSTITVNTSGIHVNPDLTIANLTASYANVTNDLYVGRNVTVQGNLTIYGTTTSLQGNTITFSDNMLYLNQGILATITNVSGNGTHVTFTANNNYSVGWDVVVTGVDPSSYNGTYQNIFSANATHFQVANTNTASYVSGGNARGKTDQNPDLGIAAGYNDGTYHHTGFFRDASDGYWKVFDGYLPEPDANINIDTSNASFNIAGLWAGNIRLGNTSSYATINSTSYSGAANTANVAAYVSTATTTNTFNVGTATYFVSNGNVGIGTSSPENKLHILGGGFRSTGGDTFVETNLDSTAGYGLTFQKSRGTYSSKTVINNGDIIGGVWGAGYDGANYLSRATVRFLVDDVVSTGNVPTAIAFRTGSTGSAEYMRITSAGNVGVGTTSPSYRLHVATTSGSIAAFRGTTSATSQILVGNPAGDTLIQTTASGDGFIYADTGKYLALGSNSTERVRITSAGDVGIGTTSPSEKLHVYGSTNIYLKAQTTTVATAGLWLENSTGWYKWQMDSTRALSLTDSAGPNRIFVANNGNIGLGDFAVSTPGATYAPKAKLDVAGALSVGYALTDTFTTPSNSLVVSGNIGVGITSPALQSGGTGVHISGTSYSEIKFTNGTTGNLSTDGTALVTNGLAFAINNREAGEITFGTSNLERMRITAAGFVGIGTSSPTEMLSVYNSTTSIISVKGDSGVAFISERASNDALSAGLNFRKYRGTIAAPLTIATGDALGQSNYLGYDGSALITAAVIRSIAETVTGTGDISGALTFLTRPAGTGTSATERVRITSDGNVGIGETNPLRKLTVRADSVGSITAAAFYNADTTNNNGTVFSFRTDTTGTGAATFQELAAVAARYEEHNHATRSGSLDFFTVENGTGANRMRVAANGNVGIGRTSPSYKLDVAGSTRVAGYLIGVDGTDAIKYLFTSDGGNSYISSNLGVANDAPTHRLSVNGTSYFQANVTLTSALIANGGPGSAGQVLHSNGTATYWASDDDTNTTYDLLAVANTAANEGILRLKDSSNANDNVLVTGTGSAVVSSNATHLIVNATDTNTTYDLLTVANTEANKGILRLSASTLANDDTYFVGANGVTVVSNTTGVYPYAVGSSTVTVNTTGIHVNPILTITDLTVSGNLVVLGDTVTLNVASVAIEDSLIEYARNQNDTATYTDALDIGFYGSYGNTANSWSSGFFRDQSDSGIWKVFQSNGTVTNTNIDTANTLAFALAPIEASYFGTTEAGYGSATGGAIANATVVAVGNSTANVVTGFGTIALNTNVMTANSTLLYHSTSAAIGTTTATKSLTVKGTGLAVVGGGTQNIGNEIFFYRSDIQPMAYIGWQTPSDANSPWWFNNVNGNPTAWASNGTELMRLTATGNLGIGTISPQSPLDVITSSNGYASFGRSIAVGSWAGIHFGYRENNTLYRKSAIIFERTDNSGGGGNAAGKVHILNGPATGTGSATLADAKLTIDELGKVGIGTTAPTANLHVQGTSLFKNTGAAVTLDSGSATDARMEFLYNGTRSGSISVDNSIFSVTANSAAVLTLGANAQERMRIAANGNVGIRNSSPSTILTVNAKVGDDNGFTYDSNTVYITHQTPTSTTVLNDPKPILLLARQGTGGQAFGSAAEFGLSRYENAGTTNVGSRSRLDIRLAHDNFMAANTTVMTMRSDGNIGIGTVTPGVKLDVNGDARIANGSSIYWYNYNSTTNGPRIVGSNDALSVESGPVGPARGSLNLIGHNNSTLQTDNGSLSLSASQVSTSGAYINFSTAGNERMRIANTGNIGIGTLNPLAKVHVSLTGASTASITTVSSFGTNGIFSLGSISNNGEGVYLGTGYNDTGVNGGIAAGLGFFREASGWNTALTFYTNGTTDSVTTNRISERMRITSAGDVGIGTNAPLNYAGYTSLTIGSTSSVGLIKLRSSYNSGNGAEIYQTTGGTTYFTTNSASTWMVSDASGNVGIGTTTTSYKLTVNGQASFNGVPLNESVDYDESAYFSLQKHLENDNINCLSSGGTNPTFVKINDTSIPFSKVASFSAYYNGVSDFIPVQPGERLYGEIYAQRETGSTGTAGQIYVGIARYDKDKNPIATNLGLTYFVVSGADVPQNSVWNKYSGYTTLPTSHTIFNGSDGGPVRYVRAYILVNYNTGTIPTKIGGFTIRKVSTVKDTGDVSILGNVGVGSTTPAARLEVKAATDNQDPIFQVTEYRAGGAALAKIYESGDAGLMTLGYYGLTTSRIEMNGGVSGGASAITMYTGTNANVSIVSSGNSYFTGGSVGIGTNSPGFLLDVAGTSTNTVRVRTSGGDTAMSGYRFSGASTNADWTWGTNASNIGGTAAAAFLLNNTLSTIPFVVTSAGSVGVGATTVRGAFNIERSSTANTIAATSSIVLSNRNSTSGTFITGGVFSNSYRDLNNDEYTAGVWFERQNSVSAGSNATQGAVIFGANQFLGANVLPTERMRITAAGNVGIGVTSPTSTLDILGIQTNSSATSASVPTGTLKLAFNGGFEAQSYGASLVFAQRWWNGGTGELIATGQITGVKTIGNGAFGGGLALWTSGGSTNTLLERMRITETGNVGIGTTNPGYALQVVGSFAATTKSFVIDHPTKPNHKLRYGSLESPYHGIRLTGEAEVVDGICTVKLPDYIHALCHKEGVNVQLTNIKHGKVLWVDEIDIDNNEFTVATETNGNYKFYWSFTAIRKDIEDMVVEFENNEKE